MNRALRKLSKLRLRALLRRGVRVFKTPRGALISLFTVVMFGFMVLPSLVMATQMPRLPPDVLRSTAPLAMLGICVVGLLKSGGDQAIPFTLPEVDFLFPGPFTRRELLIYKLAGNAAATAITSLILSCVFLRMTTWWIACFIGLWLTMLFIQLLSIAITLVLQWAGEKAYSVGRKVALAVIVALVALGISQAMPKVDSWSWSEVASLFRDTWGGRIVLVPFEVFARTMAAESLASEFLPWSGGALAIDLALLVLVLRLDADYLEAATTASQKRYENLERAKKGRIPTMTTRRSARWRFAQFPWLGGAGPIAWRQSTQLVRMSPLPLLILTLSMSFGPVAAAIKSGQSDFTWHVLGLLGWVSVLLTAFIPAGFRAELDYMDWLKMLPISPAALVVGELLPAVMFMTLLQWLVVGGFVAFGLAVPWIMLVAACLAPVFNFLMMSTENLLFLWFPARIVASSPGDLNFAGRQMLMMMLRMLTVMLACGVAAAVAGLLWVVGIKHVVVLAMAAWIILAVEGLVLAAAVTFAFRRFDPSTDMPA